MTDNEKHHPRRVRVGDYVRRIDGRPIDRNAADDKIIVNPVEVRGDPPTLEVRPHIAHLIEQVKAEREPAEAPPDRDTPTIISAAVAASRYHVTADTIKRHVRQGMLTDHRAPGHVDNATVMVDESEIAAKYPKRATAR